MKLRSSKSSYSLLSETPLVFYESLLALVDLGFHFSVFFLLFCFCLLWRDYLLIPEDGFRFFFSDYCCVVLFFVGVLISGFFFDPRLHL